MSQTSVADFLAIPRPQPRHRQWSRRLTDWVVGSRSHRVVCLLAGLWLINGFDVALTVLANRQGMLDESNPIAARLLSHSPAAVLVYKAGLVLFASVVLFTQRRRLLAEIVAAGTLFIYGLVAVQWRLCYELYMLTHSSNVSISEIEAIDLNMVMSQLVFF